MIVRMWEVRLVPGGTEGIKTLLDSAVPELRACEGCEKVEVFASPSHGGEGRVVVVSHWRDAAAIEAVAGPHWQNTPTVLPGEEQFWGRPPHVWHFEAWDI